MILAGLPPTTGGDIFRDNSPGGHHIITNGHAGFITARPPIQTLLPMVTGLPYSTPLFRSWHPADGLPYKYERRREHTVIANMDRADIQHHAVVSVKVLPR
jgi:hypothetical protein